mmetsp:Transcript_23438/g.32862  ORF Transcript_23438/g.32862 Transcript_23438/m.32862 type:complete len:438 (+) Transcript_23438:159-1472(+)
MKNISKLLKRVFFVVAFLPFWVEAGGFHRVCNLSKVPIVALIKDLETGEYVIADDDAHDGRLTPNTHGDNDENDNNIDGNLRRLRTATLSSMIVDAIRPLHRKMKSNQDDRNDINSDQLFRARKCICFIQEDDPRYCPVDKVHCGVPKTNNQAYEDVPPSEVGCFNQSSRTVLIRNAWPVVILWYGALILFLFLTEQGRHTRNFVYSKLCNRNYNASMINRMLEPSDVFSSRFFAPFWRQRPVRRTVVDPVTPETEEDRNENRGPPTALALKTKRYMRPSSDIVAGSTEQSTDYSRDCDSENSQEGISCTICFGPLEDGERIGALPCEHIFHVDCLKTWLSRRNVCPLCQTPNVAVPRYGSRSNEDHGETRSNSSNSIVDNNTSEEATNTQVDGQTRLSPRLRVSNNFSRHPVLQRRQTSPPEPRESWSGWHFNGVG